MWLVTREASEGQPLVDALKKRGKEAVCVPAIRREALPWPANLRPRPAGVAFLTSAFAAKLALTHLHGGTERLRWAAIAPATSSVLIEGGVVPDVTAQGGAAALADACVRAGIIGTILYPTSDAGVMREEQAQAVATLEKSGCRVERGSVYATLPDVHLDDNLRLVQGRVRFHAVLFSPSAAHALHASLVRTGVAGLTHVVTVGASTTRAWPGPATQAPSGVDIVEFVCSLEVK